MQETSIPGKVLFLAEVMGDFFKNHIFFNIL